MNMTRDEFNKLSQQERLNLVGEKWFPLYDAEKEKAYSWTIEWSFIQDSNGKKHLTYEKLYLNPELPFIKYIKDFDNIWLGKGKSSDFYIYYKKSKGVTFNTGTIPDGFLEEAYFLEFPKSFINEHINDSSLDKKGTLINTKLFDNPKTLTKINIALICIAVFITIINILCTIC